MRLLALLLIMVSATAVAQTPDDRDRREGVRVGSVIVKPELRLNETYESNYLIRDTGVEDTFVTVVRPAIVAETDLNRHAFRAVAYGAFGFYTADSDDDFEDYGVRFDSVLDVTRDHRLILRAGYKHDHEERGGDDVPTAARKPVEFNSWDARVAGDLNFGRFRFEPFAYWDDDDFESVRLNNGNISNQNDRDRRTAGAGLEIGYSVRSGYEAFIRGEFKDIDYDLPVDDNGFNRDSDGFRILGGVKVDLTRLIEASLGVGYEDRNYKDPAFSDFSGISVSSDVRWEITRRTTLFFDAERSIRETTVNGASAKIDLGGSIGVEHELLRTLGLFAGAGYYNREFEDTARDDDVFFTRAGLEWDVWRYVSLSLEYGFEKRNSDQPGLDYSNHSVMLGAKLFY